MNEMEKMNGYEVVDRQARNTISQEVTERNNAIANAISQEVTERNNAIANAISQEVTERNNAIANATKLTNERKFLLISDSYGDTEIETNNMFTYLSSYLSAIGCEVVVKGISGAGFCSSLEQNIYSILNGVASKDTFTDVIIACGFNDSGVLTSAPVTNIITGINNAISNLKTYYTGLNNLYVFAVGYCSLCNSSQFRKLYNNTYNQLYKSHTTNNCSFNLNYFSDMWLTLSDCTLFKDGVHPTSNGSQLLALNMFGCVFDGVNPKFGYGYEYKAISAETHNNDLAVSGVTGSIIESVNNGLVSTSGKISFTGTKSEIKLSSSQLFYLCKYKKGGLRGTDVGIEEQKVVGYLQATTGFGEVYCPCMISFTKLDNNYNQIIVTPILLHEHSGVPISGGGYVIIPTLTNLI